MTKMIDPRGDCFMFALPLAQHTTRMCWCLSCPACRYAPDRSLSDNKRCVLLLCGSAHQQQHVFMC